MSTPAHHGTGVSAKQAYEIMMRVQQVEQRIRGRQAAIISDRWEIAMAIQPLVKAWGGAAYEQLQEGTGVHQNTLRECTRFLQHFDGDEERMKQWKASLQASFGAVRWYHVQSLIRSNVDPHVLRPVQFVRRLAGRIERTGKDMAQLHELLADGVDGLGLEEARQIIATLTTFEEEAAALKAAIRIRYEGAYENDPARSQAGDQVPALEAQHEQVGDSESA